MSVSSSEVAAFALPDFSTEPSHAGAITIAGALISPAEMKSRRETGRGWSSWRSGSPRAWGRAGFLRMKNIGVSPDSRHFSITAALPRAALHAAAVAADTVVAGATVAILSSRLFSSVVIALE